MKAFSLINLYKFFLTSVTAWCFNVISCLKLGQTARPVVSFFSPTNITQGGTSQGQITSRHLKALQLSPGIFTARSKLWTKLNCPFLWPALPFFQDVLHVHLPGFIQYWIAICHAQRALPSFTWCLGSAWVSATDKLCCLFKGLIPLILQD